MKKKPHQKAMTLFSAGMVAAVLLILLSATLADLKTRLAAKPTIADISKSATERTGSPIPAQ